MIVVSNHGSNAAWMSSAAFDEVQDAHVVLRLQRVDPVEPGQRLHRGDPGQRLVHVHPAQQRLVEPGLVLVRDDQDPVLVLVPRRRVRVIGLHVPELVRQLPLGEPVELRLGELKAGVLILQRPGERDQHPEAAAGQRLVPLPDRLVQVERVLPPGGHDHRLRPPAEPPGHVVPEVLDDQLAPSAPATSGAARRSATSFAFAFRSSTSGLASRGLAPARSAAFRSRHLVS